MTTNRYHEPPTRAQPTPCNRDTPAPGESYATISQSPVTHTHLPEGRNASTSLRYLFIYSQLSLGGVETLLVRLSNWLVVHGHSVTLFLKGSGDLDSLLDRRVKTIFARNALSTSVPRRVVQDIGADPLKCTDVLGAFDPQSLWTAMLCESYCQSNCKLFLGIYHPRIYFLNTTNDIRQRLFAYAFNTIVPVSSMAFMNEACRKSHEQEFDINLQDAHLLPIPVWDRGQRDKRARRFKIVSVGRLTPFKTYNLYMIDIVRTMVDRGLSNISWHVYGDGPLADRMSARIVELNLHRHVFLHGAVPYESFADVVCDAYVFVGMGTALVEAGSLGVPCVPALDSSGPASFGYLYELDGYDVGESEGTRETVSVLSLIERLFTLDRHQYELEEQRTRRHCYRFDINHVASEFVSLRPELGTVRASHPIARLPTWIYWSVLLRDHILSICSRALCAAAVRWLPRGLFMSLRSWNRRRLARASRNELAARSPRENVHSGKAR